MRGINKAFIMGHLGQTPELRTIPSGKVVTDLSIATNYRRKVGEEWIEETEWHRVTAWDQHAEVAQRFLTKGSPVAIEGRLKTDSWVDKETGKKRYKTYVLCKQLHLIGGRGGVSSGDATDTSARHTLPVAEDEIPF